MMHVLVCGCCSCPACPMHAQGLRTSRYRSSSHAGALSMLLASRCCAHRRMREGEMGCFHDECSNPAHLTIVVNTSDQPIAEECTANERNASKRVPAGQLVRASIHDPLLAALTNKPDIATHTRSTIAEYMPAR